MVNGNDLDLLLEEEDVDEDAIASLVVDLIGLGGVSRDTITEPEPMEGESIGS
jgi:hypothetical protein